MINADSQLHTNKNLKPVIWGLSIVIPLLVAVLIYLPQKLTLGTWVYGLPMLNAILNSATTVLLICGLVFIKQKKIKLHRAMMSISFVLGSVFLLSYVLYHASADSTIFGDINGNGVLDDAENSADFQSLRLFYVILLLSHIALAAIVVPFVLFAMYFALSGKIDKHKKVVKFTYPIWLYVSITGVIIYLMISPYYPH